MKTTIELADSLFLETRSAAADDGVTMRALVEEGLRHVLARRRTHASWRLPEAAFGEGGLNAPLDVGAWSRLHAVVVLAGGA